MSKDLSSSVNSLRGYKSALAAATGTALLVLSACGDPARPVGQIGHITGFGGMVAVDEPRAAILGRDVLSAGGTAADAAAAIYFTLAVTYPSTASLGGGGTCIVHDSGKKKTEVIDFPAIASNMSGPAPSAVPANPRGFYALHAKYGRLRWESLLVEPERLAREGAPVSRALANDLARSLPIIGRDPVARAVFMRPDGSVPREGDLIAQPQLAAMISTLRHQTGNFYTGPQARDLIKGVQAAGGTLSLEDLRDIRPVWRDAITVKTDFETAAFSPPPSVGSAMTAQLVAALWPRWSSADEAERPHLLAETSARAFAERARWMRPTGWTDEAPDSLVSDARINAMMAGYAADRHQPVSGVTSPPTESQSGTGFAVLDSSGLGVACAVTSHGLFGNGRMAPGTGIMLSGVPGPNGPPSTAVMVTYNNHNAAVHFIGAASGGGTAAMGLTQSFLAAVKDNKPLSEALAQPRLVQAGKPDAVFVETGAITLDPASLASRGHQISATPMPSRVEAIYCPLGYKAEEGCDMATDPRGFGLAAVAGKK
ncbi:Gamma-glutamyltranspeptidase [Paramagnetospirillum magnetotacticum MS-1]|uniref:Gamma-glutamyltranspeptidase n=1 Tax=Paramagnetospirillum magnetotacticum MS-1 TaxID=272627 RepID=A0A0C2YZ15_PARME|nr:Gamma-glutamyltranspeptidase [Paramagnetospirillum magnetotacticum MS-1]